MPINVFRNSSSSHDNGSKIATSMFVQKPYSSTNYLESNLEEDIDLKNQFRIKNLPDPISIRDACSKNYVDNKISDPNIVKKDNDINFNDVKLEIIKFVKVIYQLAVNEQLTPEINVDIATDDSSLVRKNTDNDFNNYS